MEKRLNFLSYKIYLIVIFVALFIAPSHQSKQLHSGQQPIEKNDQPSRKASSIEYQNDLASAPSPALARSPMSVPYFRASIPMRIYECLREFSTLRCTKLYVLQKMEDKQMHPNTGNITKDFLNQFFGEDEQMGSLISDRFRKMSDKDLNNHLVLHFQRFFKNRNIKLHFLPGLMVKIVPSKENKVKFSLKKKTKHNLNHHLIQGRSQNDGLKELSKISGFADSSIEGQENFSLDEDEIDLKAKHKDLKKRKKNKKNGISYKTTLLQMAVPIMIMPAILMGTFLPFILPVLKMATLTTMIMNNAAFMAALIYAARTHVNAQDEQQINYSYGQPGFH